MRLLSTVKRASYERRVLIRCDGCSCNGMLCVPVLRRGWTCEGKGYYVRATNCVTNFMSFLMFARIPILRPSLCFRHAER